jgi:hypothetical protein
MSIIHDALKKAQQGLNPEKAADPKPPIKNKIKSLLALICSIAVTAGALFYLYKQFQNDVPKVKILAQKSFYKLINKKEPPPAFKTKAPEDLKPLARITINPPADTATATTTAQAPAAPMTLNIHGIMSNASGNLALINDQVYQEGDEVDGAKIIKINLNSITVNINGIEKTILVKG